MRWLISLRFEEIKLGAYWTQAVWITAVLFATEHGSYWDAGLVTGVIQLVDGQHPKPGRLHSKALVTNTCLCG